MKTIDEVKKNLVEKAADDHVGWSIAQAKILLRQAKGYLKNAMGKANGTEQRQMTDAANRIDDIIELLG